MDGQSMLYKLENLLNEDSTSAFLDNRTSYEYLWDAAIEFVDRTGSLTATQEITTVADQTDYTLNADFLRLYLEGTDNNYIVKYNDGTTSTFLPWKPYDEIITEDQTNSVTRPSSFTLLSDVIDSQISSTTTSAGTAVGGLATLTDTGEDFSDVSAGDIVHNTADGSDGYVVSKTSSTALVVALFGGTDNDFTSGDAYVIQPQGRKKLVLNPPPANASDTITVYYVPTPAPVFSSYGIYRVPQQYLVAVISYAAFMYKYRDREPNFGDNLFAIFERGVKRANRTLKNSVSKRTFKVSFKNGKR